MKKTIFLSGLLICFGWSLVQAQWGAISAYPGGAAYSTVSMVIGGKAYVGGGNPSLSSFFEYDFATDSWTPLGDIPGGFNRASPIGFVIGGKGYIGGGGDAGIGVTDSFYEYDPVTDSWAQKADFPGGEKHSGMYKAAGGKGYVFTGADGSGDIVDGVWEYDPATDSWTQKTSHPEGEVYWPSGFVLNDKVYVTVGAVSGTPVSSVYEYDPSNDTWTQKADFPGDQRMAAVGFSAEGKGFVGGGTLPSFTGTVGNFYSYNATEDSWSELPDLIFPTDQTAWSTAFVYENDLYMGTGASFAGGISPTNQFFVFEEFTEAEPDPDPDPSLWPVGLAEESGQSVWKVFPNPANGALNLFSSVAVPEGTEMRLTNLLGQTVFYQRVQSAETTIQIEHVNPGLYFVKIESKEELLLEQKVVILK